MTNDDIAHDTDVDAELMLIASGEESIEESVLDELEVDDFLSRRSAADIAALVGDLEVVADIEDGSEICRDAQTFDTNDADEAVRAHASAEAVAALSAIDAMDSDAFDSMDENFLKFDGLASLEDEDFGRELDRHVALRAIEAMLMVAEQPLSAETMADLLETTSTAVEEFCADLATAYEKEQRGFQLLNVAGGYRFASHPDMATYVERFVLDGQSAKLSGAALETLAIVAYKQPVSRAQATSIRGVNVDGVMRTLEQRGWIGEIGKDSGPGQAVLYATTQLFLEKLGLASLDDLPPLAEFMPGNEMVDMLERTLAAGERDRRTLRVFGDGDISEDTEDMTASSREDIAPPASSIDDLDRG